MDKVLHSSAAMKTVFKAWCSSWGIPDDPTLFFLNVFDVFLLLIVASFLFYDDMFSVSAVVVTSVRMCVIRWCEGNHLQLCVSLTQAATWQESITPVLLR